MSEEKMKPLPKFMITFMGNRGADNNVNFYPDVHFMFGCVGWTVLDMAANLHENGGFTITSQTRHGWVGPSKFVPYHAITGIQEA